MYIYIYIHTNIHNIYTLSVCLLYWYKSAITDAEGAGRTAEVLQRGPLAKDPQQPVAFFFGNFFSGILLCNAFMYADCIIQDHHRMVSKIGKICQ